MFQKLRNKIFDFIDYLNQPTRELQSLVRFIAEDIIDTTDAFQWTVTGIQNKLTDLEYAIEDLVDTLRTTASEYEQAAFQAGRDQAWDDIAPLLNPVSEGVDDFILDQEDEETLYYGTDEFADWWDKHSVPTN